MQRPAASLTLYEGDDLAVIVHGLFHESNGGSVLDWGEGVYLRAQDEKPFTFARHPERFSG